MRVLLLAYACGPDEGSEPGAGWAWARLLSGIGETWVITRANNRDAIEAALPETPDRLGLRFVYVDLPERARRWKRGRRGIHLYYLLWQRAALAKARELHEAERFDLVWHVTLANLWLGSVAPLLGITSIVGPVGGGVRPPIGLLPGLGLRGLAYEAVRTCLSSAFRYTNPLARVVFRRADLILTQNHETRQWLPRERRARSIVLPNVILDQSASVRARSSEPIIAMFAGRLLPWKGAWLAIRALEHLPGRTLLVCGTGPDIGRLRRLATKLGVHDRVRFLGELPRSEVIRLMREEVDVFVFPSLREEAGWAVAEAIASGLPVVALDRGGPPVLGASVVRSSTVRRTARDLARAVASAAPSAASASDLTQERRTIWVRELIRDWIGLDLPERARGSMGEVGRPMPEGETADILPSEAAPPRPPKDGSP